MASSTTSASTISSSSTEPAPEAPPVLARRRRAGGVGVAGSSLVELLAERLARRHQRLAGRLDRRHVVAVERLLEIGEGLFDGVTLLGGDVVALLAEHLLGLVHERVGVVAGLRLLAALAVLLGVGLGVLDHPVDVLLGQRRLAGDRHRLLLVRRPVLGRHVDDAVGVDVEGHLDLRDARGAGGEVDELELAQRLVVGGHLALALEDVDLDRRLHVLGGGEHLGAPGRDRRVALDQLGHHAAPGLDAERQRGDVEEQDVLDVATQHAGLDGGADGDDLVGVDRLVRLLAGERG